jgi:hypothetical protein
MTEEEKTQYRKAVRRNYFRRRGWEKKMAVILLRAGVVTDGDRGGAGSEQSAAGSGQVNMRAPATAFHLNGADLNLSHKTMGESHDENMGQSD